MYTIKTLNPKIDMFFLSALPTFINLRYAGQVTGDVGVGFQGKSDNMQ
jgi:threonine/homoserine/homoserine lactone efflux protein